MFSKKNIVFFIGFIVLSVVYYHSNIFSPPQNMHVFRQADCISLTQNYYEGAGFFEPEMHSQLADDLTSGKSAGEFPIIYYLVGNLWKVFGKSYFLYRFCYLLILFFGLFSLYKSLQLLINDTFWSFILTFLLFTSPVLVFYGVSFQTDAPAFCFSLMGAYQFLIYYKRERFRYFCYSMLLFALAGLIKVSSLIPFGVLLSLFSLEIVNVRLIKEGMLFPNKRKEIWGFIGVFVLIVAWFIYADYYNGIHKFKYTFNNIYPVWGEGNMQEALKGIKNHTSHLFFSRPMLYLLFFVSFISLSRYNRGLKLTFWISLISIVGSAFYFVLWGPIFGIHDYYFIPLLVLFIGVLLPWFIELFNSYKEMFKGKTTRLVAVVFFAFNFVFCFAVNRLKTDHHNGDGLNIAIGNDDLIYLLDWSSKDVNKNFVPFTRISKYLRTIGIDEKDKVIVLPDQSFNASLVLMNQKGWTNFKQYNKAEDIQLLKSKGAEYLFVNDEGYLKTVFLQPYLSNKIGEFEGIHIFKI